MRERSYLHAGWREAAVASILCLWFVGVAWRAETALVLALFLAFPVFVACVFCIWALLAGRLLRQAGGGYYRRQLDPHRGGRWRD
jgi:hypothetical protein